MKPIFTILLLSISFSFFCQTHNFKPNWKKGDIKKVTTTTVEQKFENDSLISEEIISSVSKIKVVKNNKDHYIVEIRYKNHAMQAAIEFYENLGEELKEYENYTMVYSVNKETAEYELQNWEEVSEFITNSINKINVLIEEKAPEASGILSLNFSPIIEIYSSKTGIESFTEEQIGIIFAPYNQDFEIDKTITNVSEDESPFDPSKNISVTTNLTLLSVDEKTFTCQIKQEIDMDLSEFITMVQDLLDKMMLGFVEMMKEMEDEESTPEEIKEHEELDLDMEELSDFNIEMINEQLITYDIQQSWATKIISTGIVMTDHPTKGKTRTEIIKTIVIE